jgi:hypothetical protein
LLLLLPGFSQGQIQLSVDLEDQNFHPGIHEFQALDSITMTNVTLDSGAALNLRCHKEIVLYPGVNISQGVYLETILGVAVSEYITVPCFISKREKSIWLLGY